MAIVRPNLHRTIKFIFRSSQDVLIAKCVKLDVNGSDASDENMLSSEFFFLNILHAHLLHQKMLISCITRPIPRSFLGRSSRGILDAWKSTLKKQKVC